MISKPDFFDRLLPKPVRREVVRYSSEKSQVALITEMRSVLLPTREFAFSFSPTFTGEFISADEFKAWPNWIWITGRRVNWFRKRKPTITMRGIVQAWEAGSRIDAEMEVHWSMPLFVLFPPLTALLWLIIIPREQLTGFGMKDALIIAAVVFALPVIDLTIAFIVKKRFRRAFLRCFDLVPLESEE